MSGTFTRILAKKLCRVVICSPPAPGTSTTNSECQGTASEDPSVGLSHDHRYAGRRPGSPGGIPAKRSRSGCTRSLSCTCVDCLTPSLTPSTAADVVSFASGIQVVAHEDGIGLTTDRKPAKMEMAPNAVYYPPPPLPTGATMVRIKEEEPTEEEMGTPSPASSTATTGTEHRLTTSFTCNICQHKVTMVRIKKDEPTEEEMGTPSPASSTATTGTEYRLTTSFTCNICQHKSEKLSEYMGHLESVHAWIGRVRFQCHFCPQRFSTYTQLVEHSRKYVDAIGAGAPPPPPYHRTASTEVAKITLH